MFYTKVDYRSRNDMVEFLSNHKRYYTISSWNRLQSYANNVKFQNLGIKDYETFFDEDFQSELHECVIPEYIDKFTKMHNGSYTLGFNGRSYGYIVIYNSWYEPIQHRSYCTSCGQRNFKTISESGNKCGKCGKPSRKDFDPIPKVLKTDSHSIGEEYYKLKEESSKDITMNSLREECRFVQGFDLICDEMLEATNNLIKDYNYSINLSIEA